MFLDTFPHIFNITFVRISPKIKWYWLKAAKAPTEKQSVNTNKSLTVGHQTKRIKTIEMHS